MWSVRIMFRIFQIVFLTLIIMYFNSMVKGEQEKEKIPIGVVFEQNSDEIQSAFKFAMVQTMNGNKSSVEFQLLVDIINTADAFKLSRLICNKFTRGVIAMLGAVTPDSFDIFHSYTNTFQMPFVTPWFPEKVIPPTSGFVDYAISLRPDYHRAVMDTIAYYGWKNVIYLYDSQDGLLRLQQLYQSLKPGSGAFRLTHVKRVSNASEIIEYLGAIERLDRWGIKHVVLDSTTQLAKDALISHVRNVKLGRRNYHYFLSGLVMDDRWEKEVTEFGAINITGFRVLDTSRKVVRDFFVAWKSNYLSAQAALMYDAVKVLSDAVLRVLKKKTDVLRGSHQRRNANLNSSRFIDCNDKDNTEPFEHGYRISRMIRKTEIEGITGDIRFSTTGHRKNFTLQIMEMNVHGDLVKIATWYDNKGLVPLVPKRQSPRNTDDYNRNKTYIVATIDEPPYIMLNDDETETNEQYKGFCVDLVQMLAEKLEIKYELRLVKDGKYGSENPKMPGGWDGLVGEIVRKEVDLVIAPLIVTVERERVVDFSKPFLSFDIKPYKKSDTDTGAMFSFLQPLSKEMWLCLLLSMFAVSTVLYLVSKCSPNEWHVISSTDTQTSTEVSTKQTTVVSEFGFWNSLWFSIGSFLQQGNEITPRSISGRIVGSVWWFFTLIVVSSYTANLATRLILERVTEPALSYSKVTSCPEDKTDGHIPGAGTMFDENWLGYLVDRFRSSRTDDKPCEMLVTITHSGIKDFAVAMPKGAKLRRGINIALQDLKTGGGLQNLIRKWFTKVDSDATDYGVTTLGLTLSRVAGLFYVLLGGLVLGLCVAVIEFCQHRRSEVARANVTLRSALSANTRPRSQRPQTPNRDRDLPWHGEAYSGYSPATQMYQEEMDLHGSFSQV